MKVEFIYRPVSEMVSIEKCFNSVIHNISKENDVQASKSFVKRLPFWPLTVIYNIIRFAVRSYSNKIFHITGDIQYVGCLMNPNNTVMTIHDCVVLRNDSAGLLYKKIVYYLWYYLPLKRLKYICCISEETKKDLIHFFPWVNNLIIVPSPVSDDFKYNEHIFNKDCPVILHVGTRENKNLIRVIQALSGIKCRLRIIGRLSDEQLTALIENKIDYSNDFNITDEQLVKEYNDSDIVSFPSLFEGFGLPIVEAQIVGRPVVTSNIEPMRSIGQGAILVDPMSTDSIREGFYKVIEKKEIREKCISDGLKNSQKYTGEKIASMYFDLYKEIISAE